MLEKASRGRKNEKAPIYRKAKQSCCTMWQMLEQRFVSKALGAQVREQVTLRGESGPAESGKVEGAGETTGERWTETWRMKRSSPRTEGGPSERQVIQCYILFLSHLSN